MGVQSTMPAFISQSITDTLLQKILTTLWYIWKDRNDKRFARKNWTTWQVHNAVAANISVATSVIVVGDADQHNIQPRQDNQGSHTYQDPRDNYSNTAHTLQMQQVDHLTTSRQQTTTGARQLQVPQQ